MSSEKSDLERDRKLVAGEEEYEVRYFADRHGISMEQARELIDRFGHSREALDAAAEDLKGNQMTDRETVLGAGKRLAATAVGRAFREGSPKVKAEDLLIDPGVERQGQQRTGPEPEST
jgi:ClpP class serine protease